MLTGYAQLSNNSKNQNNKTTNKQEAIREMKNLKSTQCKLPLAKDDIEAPLGSTKFGGAPHVKESFKWPHIDNEPYLFLGQLNLNQLNEKFRHGAMATTGMLYVFLRPTMLFLGNAKDALNVKMVYVDFEEDNPSLLVEETDAPLLSEHVVTLLPQPSYAPIDDPRLQIYYEDPTIKADYEKLLANEITHKDSPKVFGYPDMYYYDMPTTCQCHSTNMSMDALDTMDEDERHLFNIGKQQWVHLLQVPTSMFDDNDLLLEGTLHFWIHRSDLMNLNFTKVWVIQA